MHKFSLFVDLGTIVVPDDYVHEKELGSLDSNDFYYFNPDIKDENFPNPSRILKPGDKLWVRVFKQCSSTETTSVERMDFLAKKRNYVHTGAQGISLVYKQKRNELPKGYWYLSFDKKERLCKGSEDYRNLPRLLTYSDGRFKFNLGGLEFPWGPRALFLSFCDESPEVL